MQHRATARTARAMWREVQDLQRQLAPIAASIDSTIAAGGADAKRVVADKARTFLALATELVDNLARDTAEDAVTVAADTAQTARSLADGGIACLEDSIRQRPLAAAAWAFALGWFSSRLVSDGRY